MTREELIEALKRAHTELNMKPSEYADYANEWYNITDDAVKVTADTALAFRTGAIAAQIASIISELEKRAVTEWVTE